MSKLVEYLTKIEPKEFAYKYPFTEALIKIILYLRGQILLEVRQKGEFTGEKTGNVYSLKVALSKSNIQKIINEIDRYLSDIDKLVDKDLLDEFRYVSSMNEFTQLLKDFIKEATNNRKLKELMLIDYIKDKELSEFKIKRFNNINQQITTFNILLERIDDLIQQSYKANEEQLNILFDKEEKRYYNLLIDTLKFKLSPLNVPNEPILEEYKGNWDVEAS